MMPAHTRGQSALPATRQRRASVALLLLGCAAAVIAFWVISADTLTDVRQSALEHSVSGAPPIADIAAHPEHAPNSDDRQQVSSPPTSRSTSQWFAVIDKLSRGPIHTFVAESKAAGLKLQCVRTRARILASGPLGSSFSVSAQGYETAEAVLLSPSNSPGQPRTIELSGDIACACAIFVTSSVGHAVAGAHIYTMPAEGDPAIVATTDRDGTAHVPPSSFPVVARTGSLISQIELSPDFERTILVLQEGAQLELDDPGALNSGVRLHLASATTSANFELLLTHKGPMSITIPCGPYAISASDEDEARLIRIQTRQSPSDTPPFEWVANATLPPGTSRLVLAPKGGLSAALRDSESGAPIVKASISVLMRSRNGDIRAMHETGMQDRPDGVYQVLPNRGLHLAAAAEYIAVQAPGYTPIAQMPVPSPSSTIYLRRLASDRERYISPTLRNGLPIEHLEIRDSHGAPVFFQEWHTEESAIQFHWSGGDIHVLVCGSPITRIANDQLETSKTISIDVPRLTGCLRLSNGASSSASLDAIWDNGRATAISDEKDLVFPYLPAESVTIVVAGTSATPPTRAHWRNIAIPLGKTAELETGDIACGGAIPGTVSLVCRSRPILFAAPLWGSDDMDTTCSSQYFVGIDPDGEFWFQQLPCKPTGISFFTIVGSANQRLLSHPLSSRPYEIRLGDIRVDIDAGRTDVVSISLTVRSSAHGGADRTRVQSRSGPGSIVFAYVPEGLHEVRRLSSGGKSGAAIPLFVKAGDLTTVAVK